MALNFFKQRDIDEMDVNDIPEEFINYLETLDEAGKIGLLASRPDIAKVLGVSVEDSNQDTVNTTDDSSEIVQEDERNPKSSAVFEEEQDIRNSVNVEPDVDEPEEVNEEFIAIQNNYYEGKRLAEILKDNMEPLEALAIPDKTDKCFIHRVPFKEKQIRYTGKGATYGVVLKICPQCNRIYLEESGKEYIHEALTKRNIAHTFYSLETSNQYLRSQIKAYEIADQDKIYIPEIWTEDNPLCPVHEEALFEIPCIKKYKDRKVEFTGYFCDKCNKILMRSSSVAELEDNCALNGVPVIETESFVKKRPKKQLIKMREIKSDYIVENGKREIYTYSHAADCFKLTEEDTVVVSDSIYCSLEGHKTEEVLVLIWVNQKKGGRKSYIFVVGYCSQCQKYYISDWNLLLSELQAEQYVLNENYRNTNQITRFCNDNFGLKTLQTGVDGPKVREISRRDLEKELAGLMITTERIAILLPRTVQKMKYLDMDILPENIRNMIGETMDNGFISVMYVDEVKGIEFDKVFVVSAAMHRNEKYIAYTRALSELIVVVDEKLMNNNSAKKVKENIEHNKKAGIHSAKMPGTLKWEKTKQPKAYTLEKTIDNDVITYHFTENTKSIIKNEFANTDSILPSSIASSPLTNIKKNIYAHCVYIENSICYNINCKENMGKKCNKEGNCDYYISLPVPPDEEELIAEDIDNAKKYLAKYS